MSMTSPVMCCENLRKVYKQGPENVEVLRGINFQIFSGEKVAIVGSSGSGKTTLLNMLGGLDVPSSGSVSIAGIELFDMTEAARGLLRNKYLGFVYQFHHLLEDLTVIDNILIPLEISNKSIDKSKVIEIVDEVGLSNRINHHPWKLSGGEKRRVALCQLLLSAPDMLLLDEPTNHLDAESVAWLQKFLHDFPGTVVTITHDRYFLDDVAGWILELDRGAGIPYEGNYSGWLEQKQKRLEQEGRADDARVKSLSRELEWVRAAPKARQAKSKARINAYEKPLADDHQKQVDVARISIPAGSRLGNVVINANGLRKGFGDRLLIDDLSFRLPPGGIVGVIGPNGAGKTTLFRMITGDEAADDGDFSVGDTVKLGYVDQSRDALDDKQTVWQAISDGMEEIELGKRTMQSRAYVGQFNFKGGDQQKTVGQLSGGERNRVHLARMLKSGANLLLLDEPTNDLDVDTLRALEEALLEFAGCAVVVSHDRWFLDRIATHILAFEGDSHVEWFEGNYEAYEMDKKRRLGADADRPTRIKYKPISR